MGSARKGADIRQVLGAPSRLVRQALRAPQRAHRVGQGARCQASWSPLHPAAVQRSPRRRALAPHCLQQPARASWRNRCVLVSRQLLFIQRRNRSRPPPGWPVCPPGPRPIFWHPLGCPLRCRIATGRCVWTRARLAPTTWII